MSLLRKLFGKSRETETSLPEDTLNVAKSVPDTDQTTSVAAPEPVVESPGSVEQEPDVPTIDMVIEALRSLGGPDILEEDETTDDADGYTEPEVYARDASPSTRKPDADSNRSIVMPRTTPVTVRKAKQVRSASKDEAIARLIAVLQSVSRLNATLEQSTVIPLVITLQQISVLRLTAVLHNIATKYPPTTGGSRGNIRY